MVATLKAKYNTDLMPLLKEKLAVNNVMEVPRLQKIVLNMGVGKATQNPRLIDECVSVLSAITGQKAVPARAKKAISNFKLRENQAIGAKVTLHGTRMWEFLERLIVIALPRVRDFRGISRKGFDGRGNYTLGIKEQIIFLEVEYDKINEVRGMDISFITSAKDDKGALALLEELGLPFRKVAANG